PAVASRGAPRAVRDCDDRAFHAVSLFADASFSDRVGIHRRSRRGVLPGRGGRIRPRRPPPLGCARRGGERGGAPGRGRRRAGGGSLAGAWLGLPVELRLHLFSALERPGSQRLVQRPELDEERRGLFASASWGRPFSWGSVRFDGGGGWTRIEPLSGGEDFDR